MSINHDFKKCPMCEHIWADRIELMSDPNVIITGYMANFEVLDLGIFVFNHTTCNGTFSVKGKYFMDLYEGEIYDSCKIGSDECLGYCLDHNVLKPCSAECECAYVREVIQIIKQWPKAVYK